MEIKRWWGLIFTHKVKKKFIVIIIMRKGAMAFRKIEYIPLYSIGLYICLFHVVNHASITWTVCYSWWCLLLEQVTQYPQPKSHRIKSKTRDNGGEEEMFHFHRLHKWERLHPFVGWDHYFIKWLIQYKCCPCQKEASRITLSQLMKSYIVLKGKKMKKRMVGMQDQLWTKAYNKVEWSLMLVILRVFGFKGKFVG